VCNDLNITDCYVGHTTSFVKRKNQHKTTCNNPNARGHNVAIYKFIRNNGGWDNWSMVLIEECACKDVLDARKKEREYYEQLKASLNVRTPSRTQEEYVEDNKDKILDQKKKYYEENKDIITQRFKQYREQNRDKLVEHGRNYYKQNRDKLCEDKKRI
jgi:hypothetical protein